MADLERRGIALGKRPGLLLVDMINAFTDPASPLGSESDAVVAANARLLAAFRAAGLPVFFTTVIYRDPGEAPVFRRRLPALDILLPDSEAVAVDPRLTPRADEPLIEKRYASSFFGTDLAARLQAAGCDSLVVTGLTTSGCVRATVVDGLQHDFPVFVPADAVGDRNAEAHAANLHDMHAKYAEVVDADTIVTAIGTDASEGVA
jgi:nicotinamidase-related amidase